MKKMLKNKKGFSLIELLIVIAIMGVLAVIAFSMFSGVVANSKKKADNTQAGNIQKALVAYIVDTGDVDLSELKVGGPSGTAISNGTSKWSDVVLALQTVQSVDGKDYEAYLNPKSGNTPTTVDFKCQWSGNTGYDIKVYSNRMNATVEVTTATTVPAVSIGK
jgi:type IV pilus assembly protein PilA